MTGPSIQVSASTNQAEAALNKLRGAYARLREEGEKFAKNNKDVATQLKAMEERATRVVSDSPKFAERLKKSGQADKPWAEWDYDKMYVDPHRAARVRANQQSNITHGTSFQDDFEPHPGHGGGAGGGGQGGGGGGGGIFTARNAMRAGGIALGIAGVAGVVSSVNQGVDTAQNESIQLDFFKRSIADTSTAFDDFRTKVRMAGEGLGLAYTETVKLAQSFSKASGESNINNILKSVNEAIEAGRSYGLDPSVTAGIYGSMRFAGVTGENGQMDERELAMIFAEAIGRGGMWSKSDEVMGSIARWVESSERIMVRPPNVQAYAEMQASMNASGLPGLRGGAGEAMLAALDAGIRNPGAGEAGQFASFQALSRPGMDVFDVGFLREGGAFASPKSEGMGDDDETNLSRVSKYLRGYSSKARIRAAAAQGLLGISQHQYMAYEELQDNHGVGFENKIGSNLERAGIDREKMNFGALNDLSRVAYGSEGDVKKMRDQYLGRDDINAGQKSAIAGKSGDDLVIAMTKVVNELGHDKSKGQQTLDTQTAMKNSLTRLGEGLIPATNQIRDILANKFGGGDRETARAVFGGARTREEKIRAIREYSNLTIDPFSAKKVTEMMYGSDKAHSLINEFKGIVSDEELTIYRNSLGVLKKPGAAGVTEKPTDVPAMSEGGSTSNSQQKPQEITVRIEADGEIPLINADGKEVGRVDMRANTNVTTAKPSGSVIMPPMVGPGTKNIYRDDHIVPMR